MEPGHWKKQLAGKYLNIAARGNLEKLQALIAQQLETLNKRGPHGRTFLFETVRKGRENIVRWLLDRGANIDLTGCYNSETFVQLNPLPAARYYQHLDIESMLIDRGAPNDVFRAAFCGQLEFVQHALARSPEYLNAEDPEDEIYFTPLLSFFVAGNHLDGARWLINKGAEVTQYSTQLLFVAAHNDNGNLVKELIDAGAELASADASLWMSTNDVDILRTFMEHGLSANQLPYHGLTPLMYTCRADKAESLAKVEMLLENSVRVNDIGPNNRTALHYAAQAKSPKLAELLLRNGTDVAQLNDKGQTALDIAEIHSNPEIAALIRSFT